MHPTIDRPSAAPAATRRPGVALAVLAVHLLLALGLWQALRWRTVAVPREPLALVWVQPLATPVAPTAPAPPRQAAATPARPRAAEPAAPRAATLPVAAPPAHESTWVEPAAVAAAPAASAASAIPTGRLMDSAETRAAIRQIGQQPLLQERAAAATQAPIERTDTALAKGVASAGLSDCLKDGVPGGILGIPLLAVQAARGKCAK